MEGLIYPTTRTPQFEGLDGPWWYHHHGMKVRYVKTDAGPCPVVHLEGSAAWLDIGPVPEENATKQEEWNVQWRVKFSWREEASGNCVLTTERLEHAFALRAGRFATESDERDCAFMKRLYGCTVGMQGKFIRFENYLTIPAPAMGHDGAPAVSVLLDDKIKEAVKDAIRQRQRLP